MHGASVVGRRAACRNPCAQAVEKALAGQALTPDALRTPPSQVSQDLGADILGDLYASAEYRRVTAPVWVRRALAAAQDAAGILRFA